MFNPYFSHIYIEERAENFALTKKITAKFKNSIIIQVKHYKDVFCQKGQNFTVQKNSPALILAVKSDGFMHRGSEMCDNFGFEHFYYVTSVMNCLYDCEYCYLQGMYPSANIVVFVNEDDLFMEAERVLNGLTAYLCVSYDTDLPALEKITGYTAKWADFARNHPDITIEIRTKSADYKQIKNALTCPADNLITAFTVSPEYIIRQFEHRTPSLEERVRAISACTEDGFKVRLCIDPIIYIDGFEEIYGEFAVYLRENIDFSKLSGVSIGSFRVPKQYFKKMRKLRPLCKIFSYSFVQDSGRFGYDKNFSEKLIRFVREAVT